MRKYGNQIYCIRLFPCIKYAYQILWKPDLNTRCVFKKNHVIFKFCGLRIIQFRFHNQTKNAMHLKLGTDVQEEYTNIPKQKKRNQNSIIRNPWKFKIRDTCSKHPISYSFVVGHEPFVYNIHFQLTQGYNILLSHE